MHAFSANPVTDDWIGATDHQNGLATFELMYDDGIRNFALCNYYPAKPTYSFNEYFEAVPNDALGRPNLG